MKKVFLITDDDALREAVAGCASTLDAEVESTAQWVDAKEALFKERYDAVCIDYDAIKIEGLDAFILLDNILQKEQTPGALILRKASQRAKQFIASLDSFRDAIEFDGAEPSVELIDEPLRELLEDSVDPAVTGEAEAVSQRARVDVRLPALEEGALDKVHLARLLYSLCQRSVTGLLELENGSIHRRYALIGGRPLDEERDGFASLQTLASAFAWSSGTYNFKPKNGSAETTVEPLAFIWTNINRHTPQRAIMQAMMPHMQSYPTPTDLWTKRHDRLEGIDNFGIVARFMSACDGLATLEEAIAQLGSEATAGFKASFFAHHIDLLVLRTSPTPQGVNVEYDQEVEQARQERAEAEKRASKAYRATGTGRLDLEKELHEFLDEIEQATPYEVFDVWEGCGRQIVQDKFYEMVKTHHPDVYGGNVSGDVKQLAQEIFIAIKDAYTELIGVEGEQLCPDPRIGAGQQASEASLGQRNTTDAAVNQPRAGRTTSSGLGDEPSFGARPADSPATGDKDAARKSRIERLKAKRSATPIGLGREPSTPVVTGKSRKSDVRHSTKERKARLDKLRKKSTAGSVAGSPSGLLDKGDKAKRAFNEGYAAFRENENVEVAFDRFATAYNLEPDNGKYMTFYGYLMFLNDADKLSEAYQVLQKAIEIGDRQSLPDAHVFMGHILKVKDEPNRAIKHFKVALKLNPKSREAQREIRLHQRRHKDDSDPKGKEGFLKNLFKK